MKEKENCRTNHFLLQQQTETKMTLINDETKENKTKLIKQK